MSLKKEIIALLKTKFPGVQLSDARINQIASKIDSKITTEDEIDAKLTELDELMSFADIAKQDDRLRSLEAEAKKPKPADPAKPEPEKPAPADPDPNKPAPPSPATDPTLLAILNELKGGLAALQGAKTLTDRKSQLEAKLAGTTDTYKAKALKDFARMKFETDEEFNDYLTESETDAAEFIQTDAEEGVGSDKRPAGAGALGKQTKEASKAEVEAVMEGIKV